MHRNDIGNALLFSGAVLGAIGGTIFGFTQAGVGGAIVGIAAGTVAGAVVGAFAAVIVVDVFIVGWRIWVVIAIAVGVISLVSALWGVGKP